MRTLPLAIAATLLLATASARATEQSEVQVAQSAIAFAYKQMGVNMDGRFKHFAAHLSFDPSKPATASTLVSIDLASIDAGSPEANDAVLDKDWFNAKAYPSATFVSSAVRALGGNHYEATGKLTIKGRARDMVVPFTVTPTGNKTAFDGVFNIRRLDYAIGEGAWADLSTIANAVQIRFHIVATSAPTKN